MTKKLYNNINNVFLCLSFILIILLLNYDYLFNIIAVTLLLFSSISMFINSKYKFTKHKYTNFKIDLYISILLFIISLTGFIFCLVD